MVHHHRPGGTSVLTAAKSLVLLLAAAMLPACGRGETRDEVDVVVHNTGSEPVRVRIEVRHWGGHDESDESIVAAGNSVQFNYDGVERVEVSIWRTSDDFLIFLDSWDQDDLRHVGDLVSVTVSP